MQVITIPNDTKKVTKLGMEVFRVTEINNVLTQDLLTCPVSSVLIAKLSLNNSCPSTAPFQSPIQINSTSIEQNVSIQENLNVAISIKNGL